MANISRVLSYKSVFGRCHELIFDFSSIRTQTPACSFWKICLCQIVFCTTIGVLHCELNSEAKLALLIK